MITFQAVYRVGDRLHAAFAGHWDREGRLDIRIALVLGVYESGSSDSLTWNGSIIAGKRE